MGATYCYCLCCFLSLSLDMKEQKRKLFSLEGYRYKALFSCGKQIHIFAEKGIEKEDGKPNSIIDKRERESGKKLHLGARPEFFSFRLLLLNNKKTCSTSISIPMSLLLIYNSKKKEEKALLPLSIPME